MGNRTRSHHDNLCSPTWIKSPLETLQIEATPSVRQRRLHARQDLLGFAGRRGRWSLHAEGRVGLTAAG